MLTRIFTILILLCSLHSINAQSIKKIPADKQRPLQWKPEKGQYYFSHSLVLGYENKVDKSQGEVKVYFDPVTGTMCFKSGTSFKETNYDLVIAFADGRYMFCGTDDNGKKTRSISKVSEVKPDAESVSQQKENFSTYAIPTGNKRIDFGLESLEYDLSHATSENKDKLWLATLPFSAYPIYGFELVDVPVTLPISLDYIFLLGSNQLVSEHVASDLVIKLKNLGPDPLIANIKGYQEVKAID